MTTNDALIAVGTSILSAWGIVKLWALRMQETQAEQAKDIKALLTERLPEHSGRLLALEANQHNMDLTLSRIERSISALGGRMDAMTKELAELVGRLEK